MYTWSIKTCKTQANIHTDCYVFMEHSVQSVDVINVQTKTAKVQTESLCIN